jgi:hypothetical protein
MRSLSSGAEKARSVVLVGSTNAFDFVSADADAEHDVNDALDRAPAAPDDRAAAGDDDDVAVAALNSDRSARKSAFDMAASTQT